MIYIHGGWPKTGTTSLQTALARGSRPLEAAGAVYPDRWRVGRSHNGLAAMLHGDRLDDDIAEFEGFLAAHADRDLIFSSESLAFRLNADGSHDELLTLLGAAQRFAPVICVWTLRRLDQVVHSLYKQLTALDVELDPLPKALADFEPESTLAGFRKVEDVVAHVVYVEYDAGGAHNAELLRAFGLPAGPAETIERELRVRPRLNESLSQKQAAALFEMEELEARSGSRLDKGALLKAFRYEGFRFDDDRPWELADRRLTWPFHEKMLSASVEHGFEPYTRFFGDAVVDEAPRRAAAAPAADLLSDDDLERLASERGAVVGQFEWGETRPDSN